MLLFTGTFAWQQAVTKINEFVNVTTPDDEITVHDDFDPGTGEKDVYVENRGTIDMFVRFNLDEKMRRTSADGASAAWTPHSYDPDNCEAISRCGRTAAPR